MRKAADIGLSLETLAFFTDYKLNAAARHSRHQPAPAAGVGIVCESGDLSKNQVYDRASRDATTGEVKLTIAALLKGRKARSKRGMVWFFGKSRMTTRFLLNGPSEAKYTILLAHGAGAPMDSASMTAIAEALAAAGFRIARFEFDYMARRRSSAHRLPPPRAEKLKPEYIAAIDALDRDGPLIIGGKSMGGRVASMVADELYQAGRIAGLLCLGYPFHPAGKPEQLRTGHLIGMKTPTLIVQGTCDQFGTRAEVATYHLSKTIEILWLENADHDLKPRRSTPHDHLKAPADAVFAWANSRLNET